MANGSLSRWNFTGSKQLPLTADHHKTELSLSYHTDKTKSLNLTQEFIKEMRVPLDGIFLVSTMHMETPMVKDLQINSVCQVKRQFNKLPGGNHSKG